MNLTRLLLQWAITSVAVFAASKLVQGVNIKNFGTAVVVAAVFGIINALVGPILRFLSLPFIFLTLGLFLIVINVFLLYIADWLIDDFELEGIVPAVVGSLVISLTSYILGFVFRV